MIQLQNASLQLGTKTLLDDVNLTVHAGQKWGLIGANGSGKTSLFKLLLGQLHTDAGSCSIPDQWRIAHMAQEVHASDRTALDYVLDGDTELRRLEGAIAKADAEGQGETLAKLYGELEAIDGYSAPARAQQLLHGLGFAGDDAQKAVKSFSGGWRIRLNLARALMCPSDLLLLDEPTNHLDLDATLWLEQWLQRYPGTLLIISHDRDFLDNVVQGIISFENTKLITYNGNYSAYERQRAERLAQQQAAFEKQQQRIAEIDSFVRRFRAKATKAKQAQSRLKELERMEKIAPAHIDSPFHFTFPMTDKVSQNQITLSQADIGYGDRALVEHINLSILSTSRIGLLGHNGAGKSTLIKTLAGELPLIGGEKVEGANLKLGYFAQHQLEALDMRASPALHIQRISPKASEQDIRNFLGGFDFRGDKAFDPIAHFSGGEKARLALAIIAWHKPNVLLLDEPTNHLDLEMRHALTVALQAFEGAIVVVSHDRHLLRNTVDDFLLVDSGRVTPFDGDLQDYQRWLSDTAKARDGEQDGGFAESDDSEKNKVDKKEQRQQAAARREQLKPLTQAVKKCEQAMDKLQSRLHVLEEQLGDMSLYGNDKAEQLQKLLKEQGQVRQELEEVEERWLEASEKLEAAQTTAIG
jgi:ATP-binding cassette subfamily F protein 3